LIEIAGHASTAVGYDAYDLSGLLAQRRGDKQATKAKQPMDSSPLKSPIILLFKGALSPRW
jgi:hypothetical protein